MPVGPTADCSLCGSVSFALLGEEISKNSTGFAFSKQFNVRA